jgi:hypothetical protein
MVALPGTTFLTEFDHVALNCTSSFFPNCTYVASMIGMPEFFSQTAVSFDKEY